MGAASGGGEPRSRLLRTDKERRDTDRHTHRHGYNIGDLAEWRPGAIGRGCTINNWAAGAREDVLWRPPDHARRLYSHLLLTVIMIMLV